MGWPLMWAVEREPGSGWSGGKLHAAVKEQMSAGFSGAVCQKRMQVGAADAESGSGGEIRVDAMQRIFEADAAEGMSVSVVEGDAELGE